MIEAPHLSMADLHDELALIHRRKHRTYTTALYATGEQGELTLKLDAGDIRFQARPVRCELDFRRALADAAGTEHLVLLVDYPADRLPADLQGRIAAGKVYPVDRSRRVARLFGASAVSPEVLSCRPLCDALLADPKPLSYGIAGSTVDLHTAWRALLFRAAGFPHDGELSEARLVQQCATNAPPPGFAARIGAATAVGKELLGYLGRSVGPLAVLTWRAWEAGKARTVAALAFVLDGGGERVRTDAGLRGSLALALKGVDPVLADAPKQDPALIQRWAALAGDLYLRLSDDVARAVLAEANEVVADREVAEALAGSRYLRVAFESTSQRLARVLHAAAAGPIDAGQLDEAREALERLGHHVLHKAQESGELVVRARMAVRLIAYLLSRPDLEKSAALLGSYGHVFALAEHYVAHGAYVDFARARARGPVDSELEKSIEAMLARADALRERDDEAFARAYVAWLNSGSPKSPTVIPISEGLDVFAAAFVKDQPHRRLLVALLDGMSWANAVELLQDCELKQVAPLRWSLGRNGGRVMPMLAALPSLTGVSRAALFAGKRVKAGESLDTSKDPERFATHAGLRRAGIDDAVLYLKDSVETSSGDLHPKAIELVRSPDRVVGLVINALDDQLGGARQVRVPADLGHIKPLGRLLVEATEANRAVLLIADHGHVRTDRMTSVGRSGDGKRYRYLADNEKSEEGEVVATNEVAWVPRGKAKVAMLYRDCDAYGSTAATGEHGGASLAEIVTPAILVGSDQLRRRVEVAEGRDDSELEVTPFPRPEWWDLAAPAPARPQPASRPKTPPPPPPPKKNQPLLPIFEAAPPPPPPPAEPAQTAVESPWLTRLCASKAFDGRTAAERKRLREVIAPRVALLADAGGAMPADVFAHRVGVLPHAVGGVVSELQEWINFDAYLVVEHDPRSKRVTLNVPLLDEYLKEAG
ncbi:BREX-2 system phosphatase PglZ [Sorangium sp. So ce1000]|uniref:BREX-2 system phosphatase PglZ n=1 Tax=Sorangium sp. So ce1000 TaxID=3133325 RepID=UPI003F5E87D1